MFDTFAGLGSSRLSNIVRVAGVPDLKVLRSARHIVGHIDAGSVNLAAWPGVLEETMALASEDR